MKNLGMPLKQVFVLALALTGVIELPALPGYSSNQPLRIESLWFNNSAAAAIVTANVQQLTCPANITVSTGSQLASGTAVTYATPVDAICTPASGAFFPAGATTVFCNPARPRSDCDPFRGCGCSFKVTVFNVCLQQDITSIRTGVSFLQFSSNGDIFGKTDYRYTSCGGLSGPTVISGRADVVRVGSLAFGTTVKLNDFYQARATVRARLLTPGVVGSGSAVLTPRGRGGISIIDSQIANSRCTCSPPSP